MIDALLERYHRGANCNFDSVDCHAESCSKSRTRVFCHACDHAMKWCHTGSASWTWTLISSCQISSIVPTWENPISPISWLSSRTSSASHTSSTPTAISSTSGMSFINYGRVTSSNHSNYNFLFLVRPHLSFLVRILFS